MSALIINLFCFQKVAVETMVGRVAEVVMEVVTAAVVMVVTIKVGVTITAQAVIIKVEISIKTLTVEVVAEVEDTVKTPTVVAVAVTVKVEVTIPGHQITVTIMARTMDHRTTVRVMVVTVVQAIIIMGRIIANKVQTEVETLVVGVNITLEITITNKVVGDQIREAGGIITTIMETTAVVIMAVVAVIATKTRCFTRSM